MKRSNAGARNSPLLPPFVELLSLDESDSENDPPSMLDRLTKLKSGFAALEEEERSFANFDHDVNLDGPSLTVIVHRDVKEDEELLRCCCFHSNWLKRRSDATAREGSGQTHVMFVAEVEGCIQPCFRWVTDEESFPDIAGRLSLMKEKSVTALSIDELNSWASLLGMLGPAFLECLGLRSLARGTECLTSHGRTTSRASRQRTSLAN
jgi:hypothetical protein